MSLVDTHTHIYFPELAGREEMVRRAIEAGVEHMIFPGVDSSTIEPARQLHELFPDNTSLAFGLHPTEVKKDTMDAELEAVEEALRDVGNACVAVGEIGVDLHWDTTTLDEQQQAFERQCKLAVQLELPVIIHSRDAFDETFEVLDSLTEKPAMVFHSFSGGETEVRHILKSYRDAYFGINGVVTFKNSTLKNVVPLIPDDRLLVETDAPYLAPVPKRGLTNESAFVVHTAAFLAGLKNMTFSELSALTTENAKRLFRLPL